MTTDIRDLLQRAAGEAQPDAAPVTSISRGARIRQATAGFGVVAIVAGATTIAITQTGGQPRPSAAGHIVAPTNAAAQPIAASRRHPVTSWGMQGSDVSGGFGSIWAEDGNRVNRLSPKTGAVEGVVHVPAPASSIVAGSGLVWVFGSVSRGVDSGATEVSAIDPANDGVESVQINHGRNAPSDLLPSHGIALLTEPDTDQVAEIFPIGRQLQVRTSKVPGGPSSITSTGDGQIWVHTAAGRLWRLSPNPHRLITAYGVHRGRRWSGNLLAPSNASALWSSAPYGFRQIVPSRIGKQPGSAGIDTRAIGPTQPTRTTAVSLAATTAGLCVASSDNEYFFPTADLGGAVSGPAARLHRGNGQALATAGDRANGSCVVAGGVSPVTDWLPSPRVPSPSEMHLIVRPGYAAPPGSNASPSSSGPTGRTSK